MNQVNYVFDEEAALKEICTAMKIHRLTRERKQWRDSALWSFGLFMASVIANIIQFLWR